MLAEQRRLEIGKGLLIELAEIPIARFAHGFFAAQFVEFEDEPCFFLFRHEGQLLSILSNAVGVLSARRPTLPGCCDEVSFL
jgi:hypothetical protein